MIYYVWSNILGTLEVLIFEMIYGNKRNSTHTNHIDDNDIQNKEQGWN